MGKNVILREIVDGLLSLLRQDVAELEGVGVLVKGSFFIVSVEAGNGGLVSPFLDLVYVRCGEISSSIDMLKKIFQLSAKIFIVIVKLVNLISVASLFSVLTESSVS